MLNSLGEDAVRKDWHNESQFWGCMQERSCCAVHDHGINKRPFVDDLREGLLVADVHFGKLETYSEIKLLSVLFVRIDFCKLSVKV